MKLRATSYTFDASAKTIDCALFTSLEAIQLITNVTDNVIIYNFADATKGGSLTSTTLTLTYDTTSMSDTDDLMILVEDGTITTAVSGTVTANLSATDNAVLDQLELNQDSQTALLTTIDGDTSNISTKIDTIAGAVSGTEMQVDVVSSALPTGASTSAKQDTIIGHVDGIETILGTIDTDTGNIATSTSSLDTKVGEVQATPTANTILARLKTIADNQLPDSHNVTVDNASIAVTNAGITTIAGAVSGTEMQVDVVSSALPTGAATAAKQPALGTAGTASSDVLTVQGIASMTALKVDGSAVTQPVSGTVTANLSATDNTVLDNIDTNTDYGAVTGGGTETGALRVTIANNSTGVVSIDDNGGSITVDGTVAVTNADITSIKTAVETLDNAISGSEMQVDVVGALPAGTNAIGKLAANSGVDIGDVDVTSISAGTNLIGDVSLQPRTGNGCSIFRSLDLDESEEEVKATAGNVYGYYFHNKAATTMWLKFYNATAANVTVGTTTPVATFGIPAGASGNVGFPYPVTFDTAISVAVTGAIADNDTTAPAANDVSVNIFYK